MAAVAPEQVYICRNICCMHSIFLHCMEILVRAMSMMTS
jgi:hypothetical protein